MESGIRRSVLAFAIVCLSSAPGARPAVAQAAPGSAPPHVHSQASKPTASAAQDLASQMGQLKQQMDQIQAVMGQHGAALHGAPQAAPLPAPPMGMGMGGAGMGMGGMGMGGAGMGMGGMGAMGAGGGQMGMGGCAMMAQMAAGGGPLLSALPGFPGASHLYHVGAAGFFLDHPQHITLTPDQVARLGQIRNQSIALQAESRRKIDAAEAELWQLTGSDQPQLAAIEAKTREVEKLRADERIAFIRAVGQAAQVLTDDQRKVLLGQAPPMGMVPAAAQPPVAQGGMPQMPAPAAGGGMTMDGMGSQPMGGMPPSTGGMPAGAGMPGAPMQDM